MIRAALLPGVLLGLLLSRAALADDRPPITPQRDVDVAYTMAASVEGAAPLSQRMRWSAASGKLRVDPPAQDMYMVVDYRAKRMMVVRPSDHAVLDMDAAGAGLPGAPAEGRFVRTGRQSVAGLTCTDWQTFDSAGQPALVCLTDDGVMLRASRAGQVLIEATSVRYGAQDAATFATPAGFRHIVPGPPAPGQP